MTNVVGPNVPADCAQNTLKNDRLLKFLWFVFTPIRLIYREHARFFYYYYIELSWLGGGHFSSTTTTSGHNPATIKHCRARFSETIRETRVAVLDRSVSFRHRRGVNVSYSTENRHSAAPCFLCESSVIRKYIYIS